MAEKKRKTELAAAVEQRERKLHVFEVGGLFGLSGEQIHKLAIRVPTTTEEDKAIGAAQAYAEKRMPGLSDSAREDPDLLDTAKVVEVLYLSCLEHKDEQKPGTVRYPVFPEPQWMRDNLTKDQLAYLRNLLIGVKRSESYLEQDITFKHVEDLARNCVTLSETDVPDKALAACDRDYLVQSFILLSCAYAELAGWTEESADADETPPMVPEETEQSDD